MIKQTKPWLLGAYVYTRDVLALPIMCRDFEEQEVKKIKNKNQSAGKGAAIEKSRVVIGG